jgi:cation diffusion facilitator CzcD-associated flavoprotein CzcO
VKDLSTGVIIADVCDVFISASGILNDWKWPEIKGLHTFKGKLLHSAKWDESYDYSVGRQ